MDHFLQNPELGRRYSIASHFNMVKHSRLGPLLVKSILERQCLVRATPFGAAFWTDLLTESPSFANWTSLSPTPPFKVQRGSLDFNGAACAYRA